MIVEPKVRGFICTTAHPIGCKESVNRQIQTAKKYFSNKKSEFKNVLVIGGSTGYGLASRIALGFGLNCSSVGVSFERESANGRTATAGWYNNLAYHDFAASQGLYAKTVNGDAFSSDVKQQTIDIIKRDLGQVELVIYSLASPRRTTADGTLYTSCLKTVGESYTNKTIDLRTNEVSQITIAPANESEIASTIKVMGGEDWADWIQALNAAGALKTNATTIAYSYLGSNITYPIYLNGTIGAAKKHLKQTSENLSQKYNINARVSVNKALVTQSSAAIPVVPLYISLLYKTMKKAGTHEDCIQQMCRLFGEKLNTTDSDGYIRLDDYELDSAVQAEVSHAWGAVTTQNIPTYADLEGYFQDFYNMFGFKYDNVDYTKDVEI